MPSAATIEAKLQQLPVLDQWTKRPRGQKVWDSIWEGNEHGGHFHFYGHDGYLFDPSLRRNISAVGYVLSVSGSDKSKEAILTDFMEVLGPPRRNVREEMKQTLYGNKKSRIVYFHWLQPKDGTRKNDSTLVLTALDGVEAYLIDVVTGGDNDNLPRPLRDIIALPER